MEDSYLITEHLDDIIIICPHVITKHTSFNKLVLKSLLILKN